MAGTRSDSPWNSGGVSSAHGMNVLCVHPHSGVRHGERRSSADAVGDVGGAAASVADETSVDARSAGRACISVASKCRCLQGSAAVWGTVGPVGGVASTGGPVSHGHGTRRPQGRPVSAGSGPLDRGMPVVRLDQDVFLQEDFFMTDRPLTLMAVHAHPDDEATGTGGVLARYAAEGIRTVLVTCTDGGCGDGPGVSSRATPDTIRSRSP